MQNQLNIKREEKADEVSVKSLMLQLISLRTYLFSKWLLILIAAILGGVLGVVYSISKKPLYTAECTFVLDEANNGNLLGGYTSLAASFGFDVGGNNNGLFNGDNIIELYESRLMIENTLLSKSIFNSKPSLLIDRYIYFNKLREKWAKNPKLKNINFNIPRNRFTLLHDSVVNFIFNDIKNNCLTVYKKDKKLSLVSIEVRSADELFSKAFTEKIVANVNSFYIQTKSKRAQEAVGLLQKQADSIRASLNSSLSRTAIAADYNPNPNPALQILKVPTQRKQIDLQATSAIYIEVVKSLAVAQSSLQRETPLIQIVDRPILPLLKQQVGKSKGAAVGGFLGILLITIVLIFNRAYKSFMQ